MHKVGILNYSILDRRHQPVAIELSADIVLEAKEGISQSRAVVVRVEAFVRGDLGHHIDVDDQLFCAQYHKRVGSIEGYGTQG